MTTVFVDIDTQADFLYPAGALYVPGAERLISNIARLNRWAEAQGITLISTTDAHTESDPEFQTWPAHCVSGAWGQKKPESTLLGPRVVVPSSGPMPNVAGARQIIIEKQALDCFTNVNLPAVLNNFGAARYVVYGVVTEYCVRCAALGLLNFGARVELVTDAIETLNQEDSDKTLNEFASRGGHLTTVSQICG